MMKNRTDILVLVLTGVVLAWAEDKIHPRAFSLFSVVTFKNEECSTKTAPTVKGTCMTSSECNKIGTADGNCASAFGVCCLVRLSTCGSVATKNCTYIENPSYTSTTTYTSTAAGDCSYTVTSLHSAICNIRLDFTDAKLEQPLSTSGVCTKTILDITPGSTTSPVSVGSDPPTVCGTLTGQHMYLETAHATTAATLKFTFTSGSVNRWRIKVSQIECGSKTRPPFGCLQFFYGADRHTISSFNFDGTNAHVTGGLLSSQMYTACVRAEKGRCGIGYSSTEVASGKSAFEMEEASTTTPTSEAGAAGCTAHNINFNMKDHTAGDKICGGIFSTKDAALDETKNQIIYGNGPSGFRIHPTVNTATATTSNSGFSIDAQLMGCSSIF